MAIKLTKIELGGFRGAKSRLSLELPNSSSLLLFGENGSGKSTLTDALEWFYRDRVDHLASQEIGRNGIPALRNGRIGDEDTAFVAVDPSDLALRATKSLAFKKGRLISGYSNEGPEFAAYLEASAAENLFLRYRDLMHFILFTKADKLAEISKIIGFGEVSKARATLKTATNDLRRIEKTRDYERRISQQQAEIIEQLGQNVTDDSQFVGAARMLLAPLGLDSGVDSMDGLDAAISLSKSPADAHAIEMEMSYGSVLAAVRRLHGALARYGAAYTTFYEKHEALRKDTSRVGALKLAKLLSEAESVIETAWQQDECPLCLQGIRRVDLLRDLKRRRTDLSAVHVEWSALEDAKETSLAELRELKTIADGMLTAQCLATPEDEELKRGLNAVASAITRALQLQSRPTNLYDQMAPPRAIFAELNGIDLGALAASIERRKNERGVHRRDDRRFEVLEKLSLAKRAYAEVSALRSEQAAVRRQADSVDRIGRDLTRRQAQALSVFLTTISNDINDYYLFMNPGEKVDGIRLVPVGEEDEFVGVTLEMSFHGKNVSPPEMYLSESHINCVGICLFLASVKAFNKVNGFFVLDDVISSFDTGHRVRFGHLLRERFGEYQVLLLTHERTWFDFMMNLVKGAGWGIRQVACDANLGVVLEPTPPELKQQIEDLLARSNIDGLGNFMRVFLERLLKRVCSSLAVKMRFQYNDRNEKRMIGELLSELAATLKRRDCDLRDAPVLQRLSASSSLANSLSHDNSLVPTAGDLNALWGDIQEFESRIICGACSRIIAVENRNTSAGTISCGCGALTYRWNR